MWGVVSIVLLLGAADSVHVDPMPQSMALAAVETDTLEQEPQPWAIESSSFEPERAEYGRGRFLRWMYQDLGALAARTVTPRMLLVEAGVAGATLGLAAFDDDLIEAGEGIADGSVRNVLDVVDYLGGPMINAPVVVLAGASMLTRDEKLQDAAFTSLQTLIYAGLLGYALKGIIGRARPEWTTDPYRFFETTGKNPFSSEGNSSFPAGHAISSFGIITPWVLYYPSPLTYGLYALPVGTAVSRVVRKKHWPTDLAVGATIGIAMGAFLTRRHQARRQESEAVRLYFMEDGRLFVLQVKLP